MSINLSDTQKTDFIKKAGFIADKSTCLYKIGCVGVFDYEKQLLDEPAIQLLMKEDSELKYSKGFLYLKTWNETLNGEKYCQDTDDSGCKICIRRVENLRGKDFQKVCSIHAEANLISKCAKYGLVTDGMIVFLSNSPCYICAKSIIKAGISAVYYIDQHTDLDGLQILHKNNIKTFQLSF